MTNDGATKMCKKIIQSIKTTNDMVVYAFLRMLQALSEQKGIEAKDIFQRLVETRKKITLKKFHHSLESLIADKFITVKDGIVFAVPCACCPIYDWFKTFIGDFIFRVW